MHIRTTLEKFVFGGQAIGRVDGRVVFVWNGLPGETVTVEITKRKRDYLEGVATEIIVPSAERQREQEDHFLSCSPWQVLSDETELRAKQQIVTEVFQKNGSLTITEPSIFHMDQAYQYRNKMEYSFWYANDDSSDPALAFFRRGSKWRSPIKKCVLAKPEITVAAAELVDELRKRKVPVRSLKSVIVRADEQGVQLGLFVKDKLPELEQLAEQSGLPTSVYLSDYRSPASVVTEEWQNRERAMSASLLGKTLGYGFHSFFQVNTPVFEAVVKRIASFVEAGGELIDFYCGVGAISLPIADKVSKLTLVESNAEAVQFAEKNCKQNDIKNAQVICLPSEQATDVLQRNATVIVDPPRAGLHEKVIIELKKVQPKTIIYLSCNAATQARDIALLDEQYAIVHIELFNFFPRTPHVESLVVLTKK